MVQPAHIHMYMHIKLTYRAISLRWLRHLPGEQDDLRLVLLQSLGVDLQRLQGPVSPSVVYSYPNPWGKLPRNASGLCDESQWYKD